MRLLINCLALLLFAGLFVSFGSFPVHAQESTPTEAPLNTPTPQPLPGIDAQEERDYLFRDEVYKKILPYAAQEKFLPKASDQEERQDEGSALLKKALQPKELTDKDPTKSEGTLAKPAGNLLDKFLEFVGNLLRKIVFRTVDPTGVLNFMRPDGRLFTNQRTKDELSVGVFKGAVRDLKLSLVPYEASPNKYPVSFPGSANNVQSIKLKQLFLDAATSQCMPIGMLLAISQRELEPTFGFSEAEVERFSANDWQKSMTPAEQDKVSCKNTCSVEAGCLATDDVQGPMQFELGTWNPLVDDIQAVLENKYGIKSSDYTPHRCNLRDAIIGAAIKMKLAAHPESSCSNWGKDTVYKVAEDYCGSGACTGAKACGVNYCEGVWDTYQGYSSQL